MPNGWTIVGTPEGLKELLGNPHDFAKEIERRVSAAGAVVGHILWEADPRRAYVLTHVPKEGADGIFARLDENLEPDEPTKRLYNELEEIERRG